MVKKEKSDKCQHGMDATECFECFEKKPDIETVARPVDSRKENPPEEPEELKPPAAAKSAPIELQRGMLMPRNAVELGAALSIISQGGGFPERFKSREQRLAAYNLAHSLMGSQWQLALNNLAIVKGQMVIFGELPGTLAERTGQLAEKHTYLIDKEYKKICVENKNLDAEPYAGICRIQKKGRELKEFSWTVDQAKKAGQLPATKPEWVNNRRTGKMIENPDSPWEKHRGMMLMRKAQALGVKFEVPEAMVGVPYSDEIYDSQDADVQERDVTTSAAETLRGVMGTATEGAGVSEAQTAS